MSEEPQLLADRLVSKYDMMDAVNGFLAKNGAIVALHVFAKTEFTFAKTNLISRKTKKISFTAVAAY